MKEVREYLKIFNRYLPLTCGFVFLAVLGVGVWQWGKLPVYQASTTLYVNKTPETKNNQYYTFEGYYALVEAKESTDVLAGILKSADLQKLASQKGGSLISETQVKKSSQQLIEVSVVSSTTEAAKKGLESLVSTGLEKAKMTSQDGFAVSSLNSDIAVEKIEPQIGLYLAAAAIVGLLLSLVVIVIREYFLA